MDSRRAPSPHRQRPSNLTATREHKADAARDSYRAYSDSQRPESGFCSLLAVGIVILSGSALFATFSTVTGVVNFRRLGKSILWGARSGGSVDPTSGMNGHHARACEVVDSNACPINYTRFSVGEIRHGALPYFLGGRRPQLRGIEREPWELFCDAEANGPVCRFPMAISKKLMEMGQYDYLTATPCDLWPHIQGRTVWVLGDSQSLDFYKSLICTMKEFLDRGAGPPLPHAPTRYGFFGIATAVTSDMELEQKLYDNRIAKVPPSCVYLLQGTRVCYIRFDKMHQLHGQMSDVGKLIAKDDITVLNFGLHHSPDDLKANLTKVFRKATLHKTMRYNLMFRDSPPQHFDTPTGLYPPGEKPPYRCKKLIPGMTMNENGTLSFPESRKSQGPSPEMLFIQANMRNEVSFPLAKRFRIPIIHTYNQTAMLHEFHRDNGHGYECTHFCFPVPGIWIYSFVKTLCAPPPRPLSLLELLLEWVGL